MVAENRSDSKEMGNELLNSWVCQEVPWGFWGVPFCWKIMYRNGSKCLFMGLLPRNNVLNQSQKRSATCPFPTCSRREILKTTFNNAWENVKGLSSRHIEYWKNWMKRQIIRVGPACLLSTRESWPLWISASCFKKWDMLLPYKVVATIKMENAYESVC